MVTKPIYTVQQAEPPAARARRTPMLRVLIALAILVVLALGAGGVWFAQAQDTSRRVPPNVKVADLPVAGLTVAEAQAAIEQHFAGIVGSQVLVRGAGKTWTFTAHDLGLSLDGAATAQGAHDAGRDLSNLATVSLVFKRDRAAAEAALQAVASDAATPAQDATFTADADGLRVTPAQPGHRLDLDATWAALVTATSQYPFAEVPIKTVEVPPRVVDSQIAGALAAVHGLTDQAIVLRAPGTTGASGAWVISPAQLRTWLVITQTAGSAPVVQNRLDDAQVTTFLRGLAGDLQRDPRDAALTLPDYATTTVLTPEAAGQRLNPAESLAHIQTAAQAAGGVRSADLVLDPLPAAVAAAALAPLKAQLDRTMHDGLTLTYGDKTYPVAGKDLALTIYVRAGAAGSPLPYQATLNDQDLAHLVAGIARSLDRAPRNAAYRLINNQATLVQPPQDGLQVDQAKTAAAIKAAVLAGQPNAVLATAPLKPVYGAADQAGSILTPDLLQADTTYYGGSSPERNWNVTLGASKLDGWLIAPGTTFSVDDALGDLTLAAGYKMGWAILVQSGNATTIPAEAGGICQVVTTLFHPVFWAGLPIAERYHHSYWISLYGQKPLGMQGLDATISPPDTDFRFKNTTGNWLLIRAVGDHQNLHIELWGTNPGWRVAVSQPVITNIVKTDQTPRSQTTDKLAAGRQLQVEHAQDGFTADIHRVVYDKTGAQLDDWHAQGTYLPSHNTVMVGTGPQTAAKP